MYVTSVSFGQMDGSERSPSPRAEGGDEAATTAKIHERDHYLISILPEACSLAASRGCGDLRADMGRERAEIGREAISRQDVGVCCTCGCVSVGSRGACRVAPVSTHPPIEPSGWRSRPASLICGAAMATITAAAARGSAAPSSLCDTGRRRADDGRLRPGVSAGLAAMSLILAISSHSLAVHARLADAGRRCLGASAALNGGEQQSF